MGIIFLFSIGWIILVLNWCSVPISLIAVCKEMVVVCFPSFITLAGMWWIDNHSHQRGMDDQKARVENDKKKREEAATENLYAKLFGETGIGSLLHVPCSLLFTDTKQLLYGFCDYAVRLCGNDSNELISFAINLDTVNYLNSLREDKFPDERKLSTQQALYIILDSIRTDPPNDGAYRNSFYHDMKNIAIFFINGDLRKIVDDAINKLGLDLCCISELMRSGLKVNNNNQEQDYRNVVNMVYRFVREYLYYQVVLDFIDTLGLSFINIPTDDISRYQSEIIRLRKDMDNALRGGIVGNSEAREKAISIVQKHYVSHCLLEARRYLSDEMNKLKESIRLRKESEASK